MSIIPYCIVGFEGTILLGTLGNLTGHARPRPARAARACRPATTGASAGTSSACFVGCEGAEAEAAAQALKNAGAEEVHVVR